MAGHLLLEGLTPRPGRLRKLPGLAPGAQMFARSDLSPQPPAGRAHGPAANWTASSRPFEFLETLPRPSGQLKCLSHSRAARTIPAPAAGGPLAGRAGGLAGPAELSRRIGRRGGWIRPGASRLAPGRIIGLHCTGLSRPPRRAGNKWRPKWLLICGRVRESNLRPIQSAAGLARHWPQSAIEFLPFGEQEKQVGAVEASGHLLPPWPSSSWLLFSLLSPLSGLLSFRPKREIETVAQLSAPIDNCDLSISAPTFTAAFVRPATCCSLGARPKANIQSTWPSLGAPARATL